jgi:hypothetical protein
MSTFQWRLHNKLEEGKQEENGLGIKDEVFKSISPHAKIQEPEILRGIIRNNLMELDRDKLLEVVK